MKNKKIIFLLSIIAIFISTASFTYAYFDLKINGNETANNIEVQTGTLKLVYTDSPEIVANKIKPGWTVTKTIIVENIGTLDATYNLKWKELTNEFIRNELNYKINCTSNMEESTINNKASFSVPKFPGNILENVYIYAGEKHTYNIEFEFVNYQWSQYYNEGKKFNGIINIEETKEYKDVEYSLVTQILDQENKPISNLKVEINTNAKSATTDANGIAKIDNVKLGRYEIYIKDSKDNILDKRSYTISQKDKPNVTDKEIVADVSQNNVSFLIKLNENKKISETNNMIIPPDSCFTVQSGVISNYNCEYQEIIIPSVINGENITKVNSVLPASQTKSTLRRIIISEGITDIGDRTFSEKKLVSVILPSTLKTIGMSAFKNNQLSRLTIPKSVTSIDFMAFNNNKLPDNEAIIYKRNEDGSEDKTTIVSYGGINKDVEIPDGVETINGFAFSNSNLNSVSFKEGLEVIQFAAFNNNNISSINIPNTVTSIGSDAFANNNISEIRIPENVTKIDMGTFRSNKLTKVELPKNLISIGQIAFDDNLIENITLPSTLTTIGPSAFSNNKISSITIPTGVTSIGQIAFRNNEITSINMPNTVTSLGGGAFNLNKVPEDEAFIYGRNTDGSIDHTMLVSYAGEKKRVKIPNQVKTIAAKTFSSNKITSVILPEGLVTIGAEAFNENYLTYVDIPNTVKTIGEYAFKSNIMTSINIPKSVTNLGKGAFNNNELPDNKAFIYARNSDGSENKTYLISYGGKNKDVEIPEGIVTIGNSSFDYTILNSVVIPSSVKSILSLAFYRNYLTKVIIKEKKSSSEFTTYNPNWGWRLNDITCVINNTENVENGCIIWDAK